jgi:pimeloyl-ACP methyl ester carboxylesterase
MQVYANSFPAEVTGLVLLDPSPLAWMKGQSFLELQDLFNQASKAQREAADQARASFDPDVKADLGYLDSLASEYEEFFGRTADDVAAIQSFGDLPLTVIGATEPEPGFGEYAMAFRQFWNEESQTLARKSSSGRFILAGGSSHHIHLDAPQLVIDAICDLMQ